MIRTHSLSKVSIMGGNGGLLLFSRRKREACYLNIGLIMLQGRGWGKGEGGEGREGGYRE